MLAVLAHHLCTSLVPLDVNFAFRTALDRCVILFVLIERAGKERDTSLMCEGFFFWSEPDVNPKSLNVHVTRNARGESALTKQSIFTIFGLTGLREAADIF